MQIRKTKTTLAVTSVILTGMLAFSMLVIITYSSPTAAQQSAGKNIAELRAGKNFIPTKVYTAKDDERILKLFEGLRVADVSDGMDKVGLTNTGLMAPAIHALWKDTKHYTHRFIGIAVTVRYVPTNKPPAPRMEGSPTHSSTGPRSGPPRRFLFTTPWSTTSISARTPILAQ